jgi:hypothetical protein
VALEASVGSRGDFYDNALAESRSTACTRPSSPITTGPWRGVEDVEWATPTYIEWFNYRRLHRAIGMVPPAEFEECYYLQTELAVMAGTKATESLCNPGRFKSSDGPAFARRISAAGRSGVAARARGWDDA